MANANSIPGRVLAIAGVLVVALAILFVVINRLGTPAPPPTPTGEVLPGESLAPETPEPVAPEEPIAQEAPVDVLMTVQLFVSDASGRQLITRIVRIPEPPSPTEQARAALEQLAAAFGSPIPAGATVREIWVANGIAYLDFEGDLASRLEGGSRAELMFVYGIVGTLTSSVGAVGAVQFLVAGEPVETLTGHADLSQPVQPLADWSF